MDVVDSIFSPENNDDLFEIVNSAMTGVRSAEGTNFVYSKNEMMIPLEYI